MKTPFNKRILSSAIIAASATATPTMGFAQQGMLEEVIVSATRRDESVRDVPYNISAITGDDLAEAGITTASELFRTLPGVNFVEQGPRSGVNNSNLIIRGINAEDPTRVSGPMQTAPVVSTYINETPVFVNLRLKDLERVEVLRGPQGTLYGSGSLGGSVRYIYNKPDFEQSYAEISGGIGQTENGDGQNYETDVMLNFPISDTFAVRVNAGYVDNAGFIDQPKRYVRSANGAPTLGNGSTDPFGDSANFFAGQPVFESVDGVNDAETTSARLAARWRPSDVFEANLSYHYQEDEVGGNQMNSYAAFGEDSLENGVLIDEPFEREVDLLALDVDFDMGFASFSASASSYESKGGGARDLTGFYEQFGFYESYYGTSPRPLIEDQSNFDDEGTVFEARLVSQGDGVIDWLVGVFYMDQEVELGVRQSFLGYDDYANSCFIETDTFGGAPCGLGTLFGFEETNGPVPVIKDEAYLVLANNEFTDLGVFGEVSWHITDRWQVTGGVRFYDQEFKTNQVGGLEFVPGGVAGRSLKTDDDGQLFKLNTSYEIGDNTNVYAVWSEGFRRGGANGIANEVFGEPVNAKAFLYEPDLTENFEVGIKGILFESYQYTLAYYDVAWDDLQSNLSCTFLALLCVVNVGEASSSGIEADIRGQLTNNLGISASYTYNDSELESLSSNAQEFIDDGTLFADPNLGERLPGASEHTIYLGANYEQDLSNDMRVLYALNGSYRSDAESSLSTDSVELDGFWLWNAGVSLLTEDWTVRVFVNNIDDERGLLGADPVGPWGPNANAVVSTPRTFGLTGSYRF